MFVCIYREIDLHIHTYIEVFIHTYIYTHIQTYSPAIGRRRVRSLTITMFLLSLSTPVPHGGSCGPKYSHRSVSYPPSGDIGSHQNHY